MLLSKYFTVPRYLPTLCIKISITIYVTSEQDTETLIVLFILEAGTLFRKAAKVNDLH